MRPFDQKDYSAVIRSLDDIFNVFCETTESEIKAADAMKDFVEAHYLKVWREIAAPSPS